MLACGCLDRVCDDPGEVAGFGRELELAFFELPGEQDLVDDTRQPLAFCLDHVQERLVLAGGELDVFAQQRPRGAVSTLRASPCSWCSISSQPGIRAFAFSPSALVSAMPVSAVAAGFQ